MTQTAFYTASIPIKDYYSIAGKAKEECPLGPPHNRNSSIDIYFS